MYEVYERLGSDHEVTEFETVVLSHEQRDKGRLRTVSVNGHEVRIFLERGKPLDVGEFLRSQCGQLLMVRGAVEDVVTASCDNWQQFSRACYHLGNRHVKVQLGERWLRILPDHVLEEMLTGLGLQLRYEKQVFVPESGAYGHIHNHGHGHHDH